MSWLAGMRGKTRGPVSTKEGEILRATGLPVQMMGKPYTPRGVKSAQQLVTEAFERITWVYRCVMVKSGAQARLPILVDRGVGDDAQPIDDHPLLPLLNYRANVLESAGFFRRRLSAQVELSPRGAFAELTRTNGGGIAAVTLLPIDSTTPIPDGKLGVSKFRVKIGQTTYDLDPENVLWFRYPHPTDPYRSMTPLEALGITVDTEWYAKLYNATFLKNDGRPATLINVKNLGVGSDADEIRSYFAGGARAGQARVVDADEISVVDLTTNPRDAQYVELRRLSKEEIYEGFGVPMSMGGNAADRTYNNADAEVRDVFWGGTMPDHLDVLADVFDLADGDPETHVRFDTSGVRVLQEAEAGLRDEERADVQAGIRSIDEARERRKLPPLPDDVGAVPLVSLAVRPITDVVTTPSAPAAPTPAPDAGPSAASTDPNAVDNAPDPQQAGETDDSAGIGSPAKARQVKAKNDGPSRDDLRQLAHWHLDRQQGKVQAQLVDYFERQRKAVVAKLRGPKARIGTRHDLSEMTRTKAGVNVDKIMPAATWNRQLEQVALAALIDVYAESGQAVYDVFLGDGLKASSGGTVGFDVTDPTVAERITARAARIVGANDTTREQIRKTLADGDDAGETIDELASRVSDVFDQASGYRAEMIARTETSGAHNEAQFLAADESGVVDTKEWLTVGDHRVRESHADCEAEGPIPMGDTFSNGLDRPGDEAGDPEETINCRCVLVFSAGDGSGGDAGGEDAGD